MEPEVRDKLKETGALLHAATVWATSAHEKAMARMDKFERNLEGVRKLLLIGAKEMVQMRAETRDLKRSQKAFLDSLRHRNGGNGNGRKH